VATLRAVGIRTSFKTIERVSEAVGAEVAKDEHGSFARARAPGEAPGNPPALLVVQGDGMRIRELAGKPDTATADVQDLPSEATGASGEAAAGWTECKVGVVVRMEPGRTKPDGTYEEPKTLVQTYVATMEDVHEFGEKLLAEAERKGLRTATKVVALSDAGHGLPEMWERILPGAEWIVDFSHVKSRLFECAAQVTDAEPARTALARRWEGLLYEGKMDKLLRELVARATEQAPRPEHASDLPQDSPGRILWTHIMYVEERRTHMDYPSYRARGLPIASGHVEAMCKRIGVRMKAANKRWKPVTGSEAMVNLIASQASQDGRWEKRWPAPVYPRRVLQET